MSDPPAPLGVLVCFRLFAREDQLPELAKACPWYNKICLAVIFPEGLEVYVIEHALDTYSRVSYPWKTIGSTDFAAENHFLLLNISEDECVKIKNVCEACVRAKLQYSMYELVMGLLPFRDPTDYSIFEVKKVRNVQAAVLIIRECVDPCKSTVGTALKSVNSRTISPTDLHRLLKPLSSEFSLSGWSRYLQEKELSAPLIMSEKEPPQSYPKPAPPQSAVKPGSDWEWW